MKETWILSIYTSNSNYSYVKHEFSEKPELIETSSVLQWSGAGLIVGVSTVEFVSYDVKRVISE